MSINNKDNQQCGIFTPGQQPTRAAKAMLEKLQMQSAEITQLRFLLATIFSGEDLRADEGGLQDNTMEPSINFSIDTPEQIRLKILTRCGKV